MTVDEEVTTIMNSSRSCSSFDVEFKARVAKGKERAGKSRRLGACHFPPRRIQ